MSKCRPECFLWSGKVALDASWKVILRGTKDSIIHCPSCCEFSGPVYSQLRSRDDRCPGYKYPILSSTRPLVPQKNVLRHVDLGVWTVHVKSYSRPRPTTEENPSSQKVIFFSKGFRPAVWNLPQRIGWWKRSACLKTHKLGHWSCRKAFYIGPRISPLRGESEEFHLTRSLMWRLSPRQDFWRTLWCRWCLHADEVECSTPGRTTCKMSGSVGAK